MARKYERIFRNGMDVYQWYLPGLLGRTGFSNDIIRMIQADPHQIRQISEYNNGQHVQYLGATILNNLIRAKFVQENSLPPKIRYLQLVPFAQKLEIPAKHLAMLAERAGKGRRRLIKPITINKSQEYYIDSMPLHFMSLQNVDHRGLTGLIDEELIRKYRLSGKHMDYGNELSSRGKDYVAKHVNSIIKTMPHNVDLEDLVASGLVGWTEALDNFSLAEGTRFVTYAQYRIKGAVKDYMRGEDQVSRLTRSRLNAFFAFLTSFKEDFGREPTDEEIQNELELNETKIKELKKYSKFHVFNIADLTAGDGGDDNQDCLLAAGDSKDNSQDYLLAPIERNVQETHYQKAVKGIIERNIAQLGAVERKIVVLYFYYNLTMKQVGQHLNLSESRISQRLTSTLNILKAQDSLRAIVD